MRKSLRPFNLAFLVPFAILASVTFVGANTTIAAPPIPQRIVALSPALVELLFDLGAQDRIVGASEFSDYPEAAKKIPRVGAYTNPSIEKIVALKPDLVLVPAEGVDTVSPLLARAHVPFKVIAMRELNDLPKVVLELGKTLAQEQKAVAINLEWQKNLSELSKITGHKNILIQVDSDPLIAAGGNTFLSEILVKCQNKNVIEAENGYPQLNLESLAKHSPQVIMLTGHFNEAKKVEETKTFWASQKIFKKPQVIVLNPDDFSRLTPRIAKSGLAACKQIQE